MLPAVTRSPTQASGGGRTIEAGTGQPIFHVEHSVSGPGDRPLNNWRIVHLTDHPDPAMLDHFEELGHDPYLRVFIEVYLREDLHRTLERLPERV